MTIYSLDVLLSLFGTNLLFHVQKDRNELWSLRIIVAALPTVVGMVSKWDSVYIPDSSVGKESTCNVGNLGSIPGLGWSPGEGKRLCASVFCPGEFHGLYSSWCHKESDTTEWISLSVTTSPDSEVRNWMLSRICCPSPKTRAHFSVIYF